MKNKNKDITVRQLLEQANAELKANIEKPVIKTGYKQYDTLNGRIVYDMYAIRNLLENIVKKINLDRYYAWQTDRNYIKLSETSLKITAKKKKSGIPSKGLSEYQTVTELVLENDIYLEKTIDMIIKEAKQAKANSVKAQQERNEKRREDFLAKLATYGLDINSFMELQYAFNGLSFETRSAYESDFYAYLLKKSQQNGR